MVDTGEFSKNYGLECPYVLYCGRREPLKGTDTLMEYMNRFRECTATDVKVVVTGAGEYRCPPGLREHVLDLGYVSEPEKRAAMAGALTFVHPSLFESLSIVLLESFAAGTPVLATANNPVLKWQIERSGGGLCFDDYADFESKLLLLLNEPDLQRSLGDKGRDFVQREYSWPKVEEKFFSVIDRRSLTAASMTL